MTTFDTFLDWLGRRLGQQLRREAPGQEPFVPSDPDAPARIAPTDVLLIAGGSKLSTAIKY